MVLAKEFNFAKMGFPTKNKVIEEVTNEIVNEPLYERATREMKQIKNVGIVKSEETKLDENINSPENKKIVNSIYALYSKLRRSIESGVMNADNVKEVYEISNLFEKHVYKFDMPLIDDFLTKFKELIGVMSHESYRANITGESTPQENYSQIVSSLLTYIRNNILKIMKNNQHLSPREKKILLEQAVLRKNKENINLETVKLLERTYAESKSEKEKKEIEKASRRVEDIITSESKTEEPPEPPGTAAPTVEDTAAEISATVGEDMGEVERKLTEDVFDEEVKDTDEIITKQRELAEIQNLIDIINREKRRNDDAMRELEIRDRHNTLKQILSDYIVPGDEDQEVILRQLDGYMHLTDLINFNEYLKQSNRNIADDIATTMYDREDYNDEQFEYLKEVLSASLDTYKEIFEFEVESRITQLRELYDRFHQQNEELDRELAPIKDQELRLVEHIRLLRNDERNVAIDAFKERIINRIVDENAIEYPNTDDLRNLLQNHKYFEVVIAKNLNYIIQDFETQYGLGKFLTSQDNNYKYSFLVQAVNEIEIKYIGVGGETQYIKLTYSNETILYAGNKSTPGTKKIRLFDGTASTLIKAINALSNASIPVDLKNRRRDFIVKLLREYLSDAIMENRGEIIKINANSIVGLTVDIPTSRYDDAEGAHPGADDVDEY